MTYRQRLQVVVAEHRDDAQHVLVILVVAHRPGIGVEERHILVLQKILAELIDVDRLVVGVYVVVVEGLLRHEVDDVAVFVQTHHGAIHP